MINIEHIDCPYAISKFEEHENLKNIILHSIDDMNCNSVENDKYENITNTDWNISSDIERKYWKILHPFLTHHMKSVYEKLGFSQFKYMNYWFQQYYKNNYHNWHVHDGCNWTNVYYVELPNDEIKTNIRNQKDGSILIPNVNEGYILTLPSILWHCSPINLGNERKTVIVFNTNTSG
jgi:hypothetical protein